MKPCPVICPFARDHRDRLVVRRFITSRSLDDLPAPSFLHRLEQIDSVSILVRENHVVETISIQVDESKTGIATIMIDDLRSRGQSERKLEPPLLFRRPFENRLFLVIAEQEFANAIVVNIPVAYSAIASVLARDNPGGLKLYGK